MQVQKPEHVIGKHNKHLEILLRLTADEALFVGDPRHRNALFGLITEPTNTIEPKFIDAYTAKNYVNIDILSNAATLYPGVGDSAPVLGADGVGGARQRPRILPQNSSAAHNDGGYEALLYHLLHEIDIQRLQRARRTEDGGAGRAGGVFAQRHRAAGGEGLQRRARAVRTRGASRAELHTEPGPYARIGFDDFIGRHSNRELARMGPLTVKRRLVKEWGCMTGKPIRKQINGVRVHGIVWPPLPELREKFEKKFGPQEWLYPRTTEWRKGEEEATKTSQKRQKSGKRKKSAAVEKGGIGEKTHEGAFEVVSRAPAGSRCCLCGKGRKVHLIRRGGDREADLAHPACAEKAWAPPNRRPTTNWRSSSAAR